MFRAEVDFILRIVEYSTGLVVGSILWSAFVLYMSLFVYCSLNVLQMPVFEWILKLLQREAGDRDEERRAEKLPEGWEVWNSSGLKTWEVDLGVHYSGTWEDGVQVDLWTRASNPAGEPRLWDFYTECHASPKSLLKAFILRVSNSKHLKGRKSLGLCPLTALWNTLSSSSSSLSLTF